MTDAPIPATRVLIVDDEPFVRELVEITLGRAGFDTVTAGSAEEALALLANAQCAVALLDLNLPGMDGVQLCAEISRRWPHIRRIALTGYPAEYSPEELNRRGFDQCLTKPIHLRTLVAAVTRVIQ